MFFVYILKAGTRVITYKKKTTYEIRSLPFKLALDTVTNRVGIKSEEFREDGFGNPSIDSNLGFATSILLTSHIRQSQAKVMGKLTSATSFFPNRTR
jgi:hypothetical protein